MIFQTSWRRITAFLVVAFVVAMTVPRLLGVPCCDPDIACRWCQEQGYSWWYCFLLLGCW
jgi:hypothetical protein